MKSAKPQSKRGMLDALYERFSYQKPSDNPGYFVLLVVLFVNKELKLLNLRYFLKDRLNMEFPTRS
jgi:hypothetical protein